jgi:hypothetical protein
MKKKLIIGIILSFSLLIITPAIPALEINMVKDTYENILNKEISESSLANIEVFQNKIQSFSNINIQNLISENENELFSIDNTDEENEPAWGAFLAFIYIIFVIFFRLIPKFFANIYSIITLFINGVSLVLVTLIEIIFNIIVFSLTGFFDVSKLILQAIGTIGSALILAIYNLIVISGTGFVQLITLIVQGIGVLLSNLWQGFGALMDLLFNIFRLILEAIFPFVIPS